MRKLVATVGLAAGLALGMGCSSDEKKGEPKADENSKPDPRLKPASSGEGPGPKGQQNQGAVRE
jgi:hypothetical protein